jgi:hypothetical protein
LTINTKNQTIFKVTDCNHKLYTWYIEKYSNKKITIDYLKMKAYKNISYVCKCRIATDKYG